MSHGGKTTPSKWEVLLRDTLYVCEDIKIYSFQKAKHQIQLLQILQVTTNSTLTNENVALFLVGFQDRTLITQE